MLQHANCAISHSIWVPMMPTVGLKILCKPAGFLLALLLDRCLFVDFPVFNDYFEHELSFSWEEQHRRLIGQGHDPDSPDNERTQLPKSGSSGAAG